MSDPNPQASDYNAHTGFFEILSAASSLRMYLGFHGIARDRADSTKDKNFVSDSKHNDIGENFLDEMYRSDSIGWSYEQCPMAIVFGASRTQRRDMYLNGGFKDRKDTGPKTGATLWYIAGCNPEGGVTLPD